MDSLGRLLLRFQKQVDSTPIPNLAGILGALTGGAGQAAGAQQPYHRRAWAGPVPA